MKKNRDSLDSFRWSQNKQSQNAVAVFDGCVSRYIHKKPCNPKIIIIVSSTNKLNTSICETTLFHRIPVFGLPYIRIMSNCAQRYTRWNIIIVVCRRWRAIKSKWSTTRICGKRLWGRLKKNHDIEIRLRRVLGVDIITDMR